MNDKSILIICMTGAIIGIIILYFLSFLISPVEIDINDIRKTHAGRTIIAKGTLKNLEFHENGHVFFDLENDNAAIGVVIWKDRARQLDYEGTNLSMLSNGNNVTIKGDIEVSRGIPTIIV